MKLKLITCFLFSTLFASVSSYGWIPPQIEAELGQEPAADYRSDCAPARAQKDLSINRVRARIMTGGDKWWNLSHSRYVVPTPPPGQIEVSAAFAGALWLGGFDEEGYLKLAGQTYRTANRNEWWPGPLYMDGTTDYSQCRDWDILFSVTNEEVRKQQRNIEQFSQIGLPIPLELIPENILYWPAIGNPFFIEKYNFELSASAESLAPFFDYNNDGFYNPIDGDFPVLGIKNCALTASTRIPDEMFFWVFNDAGGYHTNSGGDPTRFEFRGQAFAFNTGNELDHMTFYRYQMVNKGHNFLDSTFIGLWMDFDVGCPFNDYIGSYPDLDLAFAYNMDDYGGINKSCECGAIPTYCGHLPAIGVNILSPPTGSNGEKAPNTYFMYFHNPGMFNGPSATTDPTNATEFYRYLTGHWRDGRPLTVGGYGYGSLGYPRTNFAFPGNPSDPDAWTMCSEELSSGDRRVILSSGPFRLEPGAYSEILYGVPFVLDLDYPCPDLTRLFEVTKKSRTLFNQCFQLDLRGPDAPKMLVSRIGDAFAVELSNDFSGSNNRNEDYRELGSFVPDDAPEFYYEFEGYVVYQLGSHDLPLNNETFANPDLARPVFQSDIQNDIDIIYNWSHYENPNYLFARPIFIPYLMVDGSNTGLEHNFVINRDLFDETGDGRLQAGRDYYYVAIAYAHNNYRPFDWRNPEVGQAEPFLSSSRNVRVYTLNLDSDLLPGYDDGRAVLASDESETLPGWSFSFQGNPGRDYLNLGISGASETDFKIRVIDMQGRLMYSGAFSGDHYQIESREWLPGVYSVELINLKTVTDSKSLLWVKH